MQHNQNGAPSSRRAFGSALLICTKAEYDDVVKFMLQRETPGQVQTVRLHQGCPPLFVIYQHGHMLTRDGLWADSPWVSVHRHRLADTLEMASASPVVVQMAPPTSAMLAPPSLLFGFTHASQQRGAPQETVSLPQRRGHAVMPSADFRNFLNVFEPPETRLPRPDALGSQAPNAPSSPAALVCQTPHDVPTGARSKRPQRLRPQTAPYPAQAAPMRQGSIKSVVRTNGYTDNRRPVDAQTGLAPTPDTTQVVPYRQYYNTRLVDVDTGKLPTDATREMMPYGLWYNHRRHVHRWTGRTLDARAPDAMLYKDWYRYRLVDVATGTLAQQGQQAETLPYCEWLKRRAEMRKQQARNMNLLPDIADGIEVPAPAGQDA